MTAKLKICILCVIGFTSVIIQSCNTDTDPQVNYAYNNDVKNLMDNYCITCHSGAAASAGLSLTTYNEVKNAAMNNGLLSRMKSTTAPMPASGNLSDDKIAIIEEWINNGYLEN